MKGFGVPSWHTQLVSDQLNRADDSTDSGQATEFLGTAFEEARLGSQSPRGDHDVGAIISKNMKRRIEEEKHGEVEELSEWRELWSPR